MDYVEKSGSKKYIHSGSATIPLHRATPATQQLDCKQRQTSQSAFEQIGRLLKDRSYHQSCAKEVLTRHRFLGVLCVN